MSGLKSRNKGLRNEYLIRDKLRDAGFVVDRVPASGASQGFKGDLRVRFDSKDILVEVKSRKCEFSRLYGALPDEEDIVSFLNGVMLSYDPQPIVGRTKVTRAAWLGHSPKLIAMLHKLWVMRADSDILVVKDDHRKPIYMTWITEEHFEGLVGNG